MTINFSFIPIVYFLFPEMGGLSLEQIDHIFEGKGQGWSGFTQGVRESTTRTLRHHQLAEISAIEAHKPGSLPSEDKNNLATSTEIEDL